MHEIRADIAVIGAGPAGLAAAAEAATAGRRVVVIDDSPASGGRIWAGTRGGAARRWRARCDAAGVQFHQGLEVFAAGRGYVDASGPRGLVRIFAGAFVLATGARELFLPFPGWTLPGVFGVGGLQALAKSGFEVAGKKVIIAGSGPLLLAVAASLRAKKADVLAIIEQAGDEAVRKFAMGLLGHPGKLVQAAWLKFKLRGLPWWKSSWVLRAEGDGRVQRAVLSDGEKEITLACDMLACAYGLVPSTALAAMMGCRISAGAGAVAANEIMQTSAAGVFAAGEALGIGGVDCAVIEGRIAGLAAAGNDSAARTLIPARTKARRFAAMLAKTFAPRAEVLALAEDDTLVCRCEDVLWGSVKACSSWREAKLHTRCGMGPCQGKVCGPAVAAMTGWHVADARPPIAPVPVGHLIQSVTVSGAAVHEP